MIGVRSGGAGEEMRLRRCGRRSTAPPSPSDEDRAARRRCRCPSRRTAGRPCSFRSVERGGDHVALCKARSTAGFAAKASTEVSNCLHVTFSPGVVLDQCDGLAASPSRTSPRSRRSCQQRVVAFKAPSIFARSPCLPSLYPAPGDRRQCRGGGSNHGR